MEKKTKILYVSPNGYLGGAERFVLNAIKSHSSKFDISLLTFSEGTLCEKVRQLGGNVHVISTKFRLSSPLSLMKACLEIRKFISNKNYKIIHNTMPYAHIVMFLSTLGMQSKKIWFQHGPVGGTLDKIASLLPCDLMLYNSNFTREYHKRTCWVIPSSDQVISLGVDIPEDISSKESDTFKFGIVGRITSGKGQDIFIKAAKKLICESSIDSEFVVLGSPSNKIDEEYNKMLGELIDSETKIKRIPFQDDVSTFYKEMDCVVHCSTIPEAFGLVVAEAMSYKKVVIGSVNGGISDILKNNQTGFTFDPLKKNSVDELSSMMKKVYRLKKDSTKELEVICENGRNLIADNYTNSIMIDQLEKKYLSII